MQTGGMGTEQQGRGLNSAGWLVVKERSLRLKSLGTGYGCTPALPNILALKERHDLLLAQFATS